MKKTRVASLLAATLVCTSVFSGAKIAGSYAATNGQELSEDAEDSEELGFPTATGSDAGLQRIDLDGGDKMRTVSGPMLPDQTQDLDISVVPIDSGGEESYRFSQLDDSIVAVVIFGGAHCGLTKGTLNNIKDLPDTYGDNAKFVFVDLNDYSTRSATAADLRSLAKTIPGFDVCNDTLSETYSKYSSYYNAYMNEVYEESGVGGSYPHVFMVKGGEIVYHTIKGGTLPKSTFTQQLDKLLGRSEEPEKLETVDFAARKKAIQDFYKENPFDLKKSLTYDEEPVLKDNEYTAGKVSQDSIQNGLNALNFVRFVAGLSSVEIDETLQDYTQKAAVVMHANKEMSHFPAKPANMQDDFYQAGYQGAGESNIAYGSMQHNLAYDVIEMWMEDGDSSNIQRVGHRRWCLNPEMAYTGFGYSDGYSAMYSFDDRGSGDVDAGYIPWPAEVMPYKYFKGPWSVSLDRDVLKLNADSVVVTLDYEGKQYIFSNTSKDNGVFYVEDESGGMRGCGPTIIFKPNVAFNDNSVVNVTIAGITDIDGNEKEVQYTVRFFDMSDTSEDDPSDDNNGDDNNGGNDNDNTGSDNNNGNDNNNTGSDNNSGNDNNNTGSDNNSGNNNNNTGSDNNSGNNNNNTGSDNNSGNDNNNTGSNNNGGNDNNNTGSNNNGGNNNNNTGSNNNDENDNNNNTGSNNGNNNTGSDNNNGGSNTPSKPIPAINWRSKSKRPSNTKRNTQNQSNTNNTQSSTNTSKRNVPSYVSVGAWTTGNNGTWKFTDESGMPYVNRWAAVYNPDAKDGQDNYGWFRFDEKGDMITGWLTDPVDEMTYYMNPISDGTMGQMMTGWVTIDGKEYYFNPESDGFRGRMYRNETTPDGHFVDANGVKVR